MATVQQQRRIAHARLVTQGVTKARFTAPEDVVAFLGAVQSQEYAAAKWSVGQRCRGVGEGDVDAALADGRILRTHILRPTWHYIAPADAHWLTALSGPRVHAVNAYQYRSLDIDRDVMARSRRVLTKALRDGHHLTRAQIAAQLAGAGITAKGSRLAYIVMHAELDGLITSGVPAGKQPTYALLDERAPEAERLPREEALARLVLRYFTGHGPASLRDCSWWSGLTVADARRGVEMVRPQLERAELDGIELWHAGGLLPRTRRKPVAHLLQAYDEMIVGYSATRGVLDIDGFAEPTPLGRAAPFIHALVLDSQLIGRWRRGSRAGERVELQLGRRLDPEERQALAAAIARYEAFLDAARALP